MASTPAELARAKRTRVRNRDRIRIAKRRAYMRDKHGLTVEQYEAMMCRHCDWCAGEFVAGRTETRWCSVECRGKIRALWIAHKMTPADLRAALAGQAFQCAACADPIGMDDKQVDHDHSTGALRGLLCAPCNLTIGNARESVSRLLGIAHYLRIHQ